MNDPVDNNRKLSMTFPLTAAFHPVVKHFEHYGHLTDEDQALLLEKPGRWIGVSATSLPLIRIRPTS